LAGVYKESIDYGVFSGEWNIARIYERRGPVLLVGARRYSPPDIPTDGAAATLKAAKAEFRKSWDAWKAWAKLEEVA
jgi:hypothetical protein